MKKVEKELTKMFQVDLAPSKKFEKQLRSQLSAAAKPKAKFLPWKRIALAATSLALVGILALSLYRPAEQPDQSQKNILLSKLYQTAFAAPEVSQTTFWKMKTKWGGGPKADACQDLTAEGLGATSDDRNQQPVEVELLFREGNVTASLEKMVDDGGLGANAAYFDPVMAYSEDLSRSAWREGDFFGNLFEPFMRFRDEVVLTDKDGNPLPAYAAVPEKAEGTYELYSKVETAGLPGDYGDCKTLLARIVMDAKTNMLVSARSYVNSVDEANVIWVFDREIETASGDFASVEPRFVAEGFNRRQAKEYVDRLPEEYWQQ